MSDIRNWTHIYTQHRGCVGVDPVESKCCFRRNCRKRGIEQAQAAWLQRVPSCSSLLKDLAFNVKLSRLGLAQIYEPGLGLAQYGFKNLSYAPALLKLKMIDSAHSAYGFLN